MREVYNPHEIEARWAVARRSQVDLDHAARLFYNMIEFPYPSGEGFVTTRATTGNTPHVHVFAVAPWGLKLHSAKVGGIMPLTLPYLQLG